METEINGLGFIKSRAEEVKQIESSIEKTTKKTMLFQRLPFHKRRRTNNHDTRRTPKRHIKRHRRRRLNKSHLRTHVWYAKRFFMAEMWGCKIPVKRAEKSDSFIYKSRERGYMFDESYKRVLVFQKSHSSLVNSDQTFVVQKIVINNIECEVVVTNLFIILVTFDLDEVVDLFKKEMEFFKEIDCVISLYKGKDPTACLNEGIEETLVDDYLLSGNEDGYFFVKAKGKMLNGKIFMSKSKVMSVWQKLVIKGVIPICINELLRLSLENRELVFPFDYPYTSLYKQYEEGMYKQVEEKHNRTPPSKRVNYSKNGIDHPFYIPEVEGGRVYFFEMKKGCLERCAVISNGEKVIGYVVRGAYCFSIGRSRGVCYIKEKSKRYFGRNINSKTDYEISIKVR
jgi:hypothetical protein